LNYLASTFRAGSASDIADRYIKT